MPQISVFTTSRVNKKVLEQFKNLKLIALRSVGFNHIDLEYCREHNISVVNSPNYGNITVAEFALALLLDVCRKVTVSYSEYKNSRVSPSNLIGTELNGKTVGIESSVRADYMTIVFQPWVSSTRPY